jgi:hypothetical protein
MRSLLAGLQFWFLRYFIGYGEYRYLAKGKYYGSRRGGRQPPLRSVGPPPRTLKTSTPVVARRGLNRA